MNRHMGIQDIFLEIHPPAHNTKLTFDILLWTLCEGSHTGTDPCDTFYVVSHVSPEHKTFLFFTGLNNEDTNIFGMASLQKVGQL